MFFWINKNRSLFTICALLLLNNPMSTTAGEANFYTLQKNGGGYSELVIGVVDATNSNNIITIPLKISGSPVDEKFGEYLMAAMTSAFIFRGAHFDYFNAEYCFFSSLPGHLLTGIRFPMIAQCPVPVAQFTIDLYKDGNNDIVVVIDNDAAQTIKLRSSATSEEIAYFDYAVNTILVSKYIKTCYGVPLITDLSGDKYSFSIKCPGCTY